MAKKAAVKETKVETVEVVSEKKKPIKYWESAPDINVSTENGAAVRLWLDADKLQVQQDNWLDKQTSEERRGKTVAVSFTELVTALKANKEATKAVENVLKEVLGK